MQRRSLFPLAVCSAALFRGVLSRAQSGHQHSGAGQGHRHMDRRFTDPEELTKRFDNPERDSWQMPDRVIASLELKPGQTVADIGAGTGYFSVRLARGATQPKVIAVDIEETMVAWLKDRAAKEKLPNLSAVLGSADSANLPGPVDVVLVVNTYHHIADRKGYFGNLRSSLRSGGKLAIVDWKKGALMGPPDEHRFPAETIQEELAAAGYRLMARHDYLPHQNYLIFDAPER